MALSIPFNAKRKGIGGAEAYLELNLTSTRELFAKTFNGF